MFFPLAPFKGGKGKNGLFRGSPKFAALSGSFFLLPSLDPAKFRRPLRAELEEPATRAHATIRNPIVRHVWGKLRATDCRRRVEMETKQRINGKWHTRLTA